MKVYKYILFQTIRATHCFHSTGSSGREAKKPLPCLWFKTLSERDPEELSADTYIHTHNIYIYMERTYDEQVERSVMYKIIKKQSGRTKKQIQDYKSIHCTLF